ncbi:MULTISPECIES: branched-chain amino acid ABC transporter permease [Variovorax]|jgi:branched-chain amino acid transport system permease protein|uniref:branched-chain amino acid ABC transporter permease n=1 Tax=Variovorax TaxID=34072 RepID=UPI0003925B80|nr:MULTISPECIES: branched-chain amino acid ABC transporter permease [unclassified Variovorax]AGU10431.1 Branched-chain amino acid transport system/permease component [uncultured organism]MDM0119548.1 branched-chain amino acid ABC transporter permease [Variovorax sp. J2L1-78]MDM0128540.1 branched-chain amino acid ABC transporter permease [Variovorax sp. J2L1-63]MDM0232240.1 branched-chain amino acid ABC transporter permease [Variovorax sp. J2R1-6]
MFDAFLVQQLANGLSLGLVYALMAIGFTLIFGVLNVVNFAHGEIYMLGAYAGLLFITSTAPPLFAVLLFVLAVGAALGFSLERIAFRPFRRFRDEASLKSKAIREATLLSSLALSIVIRELVEKFFGASMQTIPQDYLLMTPIEIGPISFSSGQFVIFGLSIVMLAGLYFLLFRTRIGLSIRAVANNPMGAMYVGLNTERTIVATFVIGSMMGAVAGLVVGLYQGSIFPSMGFTPGVKAFVAMVMGGLSSIGGAVVCALILGMAEALTTTFVAQGWGDMVAYLFLLITLVFFPTGLFGGGRERA